MSVITEHIELSLDEDIISRLDDWREREEDPPSREDALLTLVERGLTRSAEREIGLSGGDKLIIYMLRDIYKHLKLHRTGGLDCDSIVEAIENGHHWALSEQAPILERTGKTSRKQLEFVLNVLDMWNYLERGFDRLSTVDQELVRQVPMPPFGKHVRFPGFDLNNETRLYTTAKFIIDKQHRFERFAGRYLNSHFEQAPGYRNMYPVFRSIQRNMPGDDLNAQQIIDILRARRPDLAN